MNDDAPPSRHRPGELEARWAARTWLVQPQAMAVRTEPVIAIVAELHDVLTNSHFRDEDKFAALRRAVRLLSAFVAGKDTTRTWAERL